METAADGAFTVGYYARNQDETGIMELTGKPKYTECKAYVIGVAPITQLRTCVIK